MDHQYQDFVIVGGGIAGLSAANCLADFKAKATLIEAGTYPTHKVCGEFLSPECLSHLKSWGILPDCLLDKGCFFSKGRSFNFPFPFSAGSMSRYRLDTLLAKRAEQKGISILTGEKVLHLERGKTCTLYLSSGKKISTSQLLLGTGKIPSKELQIKPCLMEYVGIKAHFSHEMPEKRLEMHFFPGAYVGVSPINEGEVNVACLVKIQKLGQDTPEQYMKKLLSLSSVSSLKKLLLSDRMLFSDWMRTSVPKFSAKKNPFWENVYFIGDAAGGTPPATGNGLAMGITSGCMAAKFAMVGDAEGFRKAWKARYLSRILWGKCLHKLMMNQFLSRAVIDICCYFPGLASGVFSLTREKQS